MIIYILYRKMRDEFKQLFFFVSGNRNRNVAIKNKCTNVSFNIANGILKIYEVRIVYTKEVLHIKQFFNFF